MVTSRYLSPEPKLQEPTFVRNVARLGHSVPTYSYALNNPVRYTDPDGNFVPFLVVPAGLKLAAAFGVGFGVGLGFSQFGRTTSTVVPPSLDPTLDPTMGGRGMRGGRPRIPGTTCSSQPLDEKQQECKLEGNNAGTKAVMQGKSDEEANLVRAAAYCLCMGATDSATCADELARIGWSGYL